MNKVFEKILTLLFSVFRYRIYRNKYKLPKSFKFNGYFIQFYGDGEISVGDNSYISFFSHVAVVKNTKLVIGNNVSIAHNVRIYTTGLDTETFILNGKKKEIKKDVLIGNNVLIGTNTYINPGITIGDNVFIGANSVITHDIPSNSLVGGVPAKIIKSFNI